MTHPNNINYKVESFTVAEVRELLGNSSLTNGEIDELLNRAIAVKKAREEIKILSNMRWVGVLGEDDVKYVPFLCEIKHIYKGDGSLPTFKTKEECQQWCNDFNNNLIK